MELPEDVQDLIDEVRQTIAQADFTTVAFDAGNIASRLKSLARLYDLSAEQFLAMGHVLAATGPWTAAVGDVVPPPATGDVQQAAQTQLYAALDSLEKALEGVQPSDLSIKRGGA